MRRFSHKGFGIRFALALILPITGVSLVVWTLVQLLIYQTSHV